MAIQMTMHQYGTSVRSHVWHDSILYIFAGSIRQAKKRARFYPFTHGPDVADLLTTLNPEVPHPTIQATSLIWMDDIPYVFPGSLAVASERGKGHKARWVQVRRERRRVERSVLEGFAKQYGNGIGEDRGQR